MTAPWKTIAGWTPDGYVVRELYASGERSWRRNLHDYQWYADDHKVSDVPARVKDALAAFQARRLDSEGGIPGRNL
jgi:hypothetical protein